jgi:hypothetical protein
LERCVLGNTGEYRQIICPITADADMVMSTYVGHPPAGRSTTIDVLERQLDNSCDLDCDRVNHGDKKARGQRAEVFAQFVVDSFSSEVLSHGVLDVAGGRGEVSMALAAVGVTALVIDPREHAGCLNQRLRRVMKKQNLPPLQAWHVYFPPDAESLESNAGKEFTPVLQRAQVVLGLHPDEATEGVVDWAIEHKRGFCIVPCCVFARLFPDRYLVSETSAAGTATGRRKVRTHADLCLYLLRKHRGIRCTQLNFEGMNTCLWATAEDLAY